ncbi:amino acid ABC transporter substrate-binding protein [Sporomusa malonica]|uniref:Amino acid ABC transporter substrate-binding protein, PAAT family n=1 Tax=Sporomusa malonica TaxID=112901 RepID=A0A1W1YGS4_9FIRM|nr:amino acid ABC transporter substrate-binding protein [Sporomusa malonica]SMC35346.1 amino acid ABC transporter substrate-binding protein, PAAT family [Sporomusa malonica]
MKKLIAAMLVLLLAGLLVAGCGGADKKKIVVGLDDNFPPMGFRDDKNNIVGFDVDMAKEAAKRLGMEVEFKPIDWNSKEAELSGKRVDMLWNGLTITEKRKENILFTKAYMENRQIIVVAANSPIKTKTDLAGKVVGGQEGSSSIEAIEKDAATMKSFKELKKFGDNVAALMDLKTGRLDAVVVDEIVGRYYIAKKPGEYTIIADNFGSEEYGVGLRKEDKELLAKLQKAMDEMKKDGTSAKISKQWFGDDIVK